MRLTFLFFLIQCSVFVYGQRIDLRNDSLFINTHFVNGLTSKSTLDSLLKSKGYEKTGHSKSFPNTNEIHKLTSYIYYNKGLIFGKNDYEKTHLSVSVKLKRNENSRVDENNMQTDIFRGNFFIGDYCINNIKNYEQLQYLKDCSVSGDIIYDIVYQDRKIKAFTDFQTGALTIVVIY